MDLITWQEGHKLVVSIYKVTKIFPREEIYAMTDQMRRASSSVTANIAEGFGRKTYKEKLQFYYQSQGSLTELKDFLLIAKDVGYLSEDQTDNLMDQANHTHKLLQGLIQKTKSYIS
ncbi:MAG: four helix bundle protein [Candidatus Levybacteria bacterium]|nr:four helix bundle protein [Candidatus Levybacteria bacterium]